MNHSLSLFTLVGPSHTTSYVDAFFALDILSYATNIIFSNLDRIIVHLSRTHSWLHSFLLYGTTSTFAFPRWYVVPTGRVKVPAGRYVVPTGGVKVPAGRYVVPTGKDNVIVEFKRISLTGFHSCTSRSRYRSVSKQITRTSLIHIESHHRFFPVDTSLIHIESRKSPTKSLFDVGSRRISIFTVNTK
ncbi:hypothetical protein Tco_0968563 [Tanacetum coccineum]